MLTNTGFKKALAIIFSIHQQLEPKENKDFIYKAWFRMLHDISDEDLLNAVTRFITENTKLYPGDNFIAIIRQIAKPAFIETEGDAVELAFEAASMFGRYKEAEAMAWIRSKSKLVAAAVQRLGFLELCDSTQPDVIRGQLRAIFAAEKSRAKEIGAVCDSATQLDDGINKKLLDFVAGFKIGGKSE